MKKISPRSKNIIECLKDCCKQLQHGNNSYSCVKPGLRALEGKDKDCVRVKRYKIACSVKLDDCLCDRGTFDYLIICKFDQEIRCIVIEIHSLHPPEVEVVLQKHTKTERFRKEHNL